MRLHKTVLVARLLCGVLCAVGIGCGAASTTHPSSSAQAATKTAAQMTKAEFHQRLEEVLRDGGKPEEVAGIVVDGVCDAALLERAFGKPNKVDSDGWHWTVSDGAMSISVESEGTRDGQRILTINGITESSNSTDATAVEKQAAPDFDPKFTVEWPGPPIESRSRIAAGTPDETTLYTGKHTAFEPITIFNVTVHEFTEQSLQGTDSKEMLQSNALQNIKSPGHTLTEIQRQGHHGMEATGRDDAAHFRRVVVLAERRLYRVEVVSLHPDRLKADDVTKFVDSFQIKD